MASARIGLARHESGLLAEPQSALEDAWQDALSGLHLLLRLDSEAGTRLARELVSRIAERRRLLAQAPAPPSEPRVGLPRPHPGAGPVRIVHVTSVVRDLLQMADAFADSDEPVPSTGETGTGKELFARRLHEASRRRGRELVAVTCRVPESPFGREFFGHVRVLTAAPRAGREGLAARADGGTLFLD